MVLLFDNFYAPILYW